MQRKFCHLLLVFMGICYQSFSQQADSIPRRTDSVKKNFHIAGAVLVTNNGISLIPTFSLGKPAAMFTMSAGGQRLTFEPEFRMSLEGQPWSILLWWRYKLVKKPRFLLNVGIHPALNFKSTTVDINGETKDVMVSRRFLTGEIAPTYFLSKSISVGTYYLFGHGFDMNTPKWTHFLTLNANFSNINFFKHYSLRIVPQVYYLRQDDEDGFFVTSTITLARRNFPLSISSIMNKTIETEIEGVEDFVWNINLIYAFHKDLVKK